MARRAGAFIIAGAVAISGPLRAKTLEAPGTQLPATLSATALEAQTVVSADLARLLVLFQRLQAQARAEHVETRMANVIAAELGALGFDVNLAADQAQVVGILRNGPGPTLLYRADTGTELSIDALIGAEPPSASEEVSPGPKTAASVSGKRRGPPTAGLTQRCGPDVHVAWMLGMAKALVSLRSEWQGTLVLVGEATRLSPGGTPTPASAAPSSSRIPTPNFLLALRAAPVAVGSMLSVQGMRKPGSDEVDVSYETTGAYSRSSALPRLLTSTARVKGLPENVHFSYLLVGVAEVPAGQEQEQEQEDPAAVPDALSPVQLDLAAIPFGTKLATAAVFELLHKRLPTSEDGPSQASRRLTGAAGVDLTLHRY